MKFISNPIMPEIKIVQPTIFSDNRGYFFEYYHEKKFKEAGITVSFIQDNQSRSRQQILRGLHFQYPPYAQAKLVRVIEGEIYDVAVDIRSESSTYGKWAGYKLSQENNQLLYIPEGFAHGLYVTSDYAIVNYKCSSIYSKEHEGCLIWDDPTVAIHWPENIIPILSEKDKLGKKLEEIHFNKQITRDKKQ